MERKHNEWDQTLRRKMGAASHPTQLEWTQVEERLPVREARIRKIGWILKVAAIILAAVASYSLLDWYSGPSWEYSSVASVQSLENSESSFFSAKELHQIYIPKNNIIE